MNIYNKLIKENIAPIGTKQIAVYNETGNKVGVIPLSHLEPPKNIGTKIYSFGALSDIHLSYTTGESDFVNVLNYFNNTYPVDFICISGDLSVDGTNEKLSVFKQLRDSYSQNIPVYVSAGNHDAYDSSHNLRDGTLVSESMLAYTGKPLYYSFEHGNDVFIFVGFCNGSFSKDELQWLYATLEKYRNRRCFLFQHVFAYGGCGNIFGLYNQNIANNTMFEVFLSLLRHYSNVLWFHGHSHTMFHGQEYGMIANYDNIFCRHSVHVPSCAVPRTDKDGDMEFQLEYQESEGYVVDVYDNGINLKGRDFVRNEFLPIASYWLDTTIIEVQEKTYVDSTGTIDINNLSTTTYTNQIPISTDTDGTVLNDVGYLTGTRISVSSGSISAITNPNAQYASFTTGFIPVKKGDVIRLKNCWMDTAQLDDTQSPYGHRTWGLVLAFYDAKNTTIETNCYWTDLPTSALVDAIIDSDGKVTQFIVNVNHPYMRLNLGSSDPSQAILTINEEIN